VWRIRWSRVCGTDVVVWQEGKEHFFNIGNDVDRSVDHVSLPYLEEMGDRGSMLVTCLGLECEVGGINLVVGNLLLVV
jgi:hypothetical protein